MNREPAEASLCQTELQVRGGTRFDWHALAGMAGRQHGVVSLEQVVSLGLSRSGVRDLVGAGKLRRVHRGVFFLGALPLTSHANWSAAVLACGRGSLLSYRSAAALWGLLVTSRSLIDVIARGQVRRRHDGVDAHGCSGLLPRDRAVWDLIPCTSVALTLLHLAAVVNESTLARAVEQAEIRRLFDLRAIDDVLERFAGHRGAKRLRAAVRRIGGGSRTSRNAFEDRFLSLTARMSLPPPLANFWIELPGGIWHELDFHWPDLGLAVELDGLETHGTRSGQRKDRSKDRLLAAAGIQVIRFIWEDLDRPAQVIAEVEAVAAQRGRERMKSIASATSSVSASRSS